MTDHLRLLCLTAHPDDETLGNGGTLARCHDEGIETYVVCATRGEKGRFGDAETKPPPEIVGETRERELREAAAVLGVREVAFLDYIDGELDAVDTRQAVARIAAHIRRICPQVVLTFAPDGGYGHPDHIAISQLAAAGIVRAADAGYSGTESERVGGTAHATDKFYYMAWTERQWAAYQAAFKDLKSTVDGVERRATPWPDWAVTTCIDTRAYWQTVWRAVQCHRTQVSIFRKLADLAPEHHQAIWGSQTYYRVFSTVNGGRRRETDLFQGLR